MSERLPLGNGSLSTAELVSAFSALHADVTFVDADGIVRYFSAYRIFARPAECLGRHVLDCHAPSSRPGIELMLSEFASGERDEAYFATEKDGRQVHVRYQALRDARDAYLGCLEVCVWADGA